MDKVVEALQKGYQPIVSTAIGYMKPRRIVPINAIWVEVVEYYDEGQWVEDTDVETVQGYACDLGTDGIAGHGFDDDPHYYFCTLSKVDDTKKQIIFRVHCYIRDRRVEIYDDHFINGSRTAYWNSSTFLGIRNRSTMTHSGNHRVRVVASNLTSMRVSSPNFLR